MSTMSTPSTARIPSRCMCKFAPQKQLTSALVKCPSALGSVRNICKTFGLKATQSFKASMATYKAKLICEDGSEHEFEASNDCYIFDSAENAGVELPYSCRVRWLFPGRKAGGGGLLADLRLIPDFRLRDSYSQGN